MSLHRFNYGLMAYSEFLEAPPSSDDELYIHSDGDNNKESTAEREMVICKNNHDLFLTIFQLPAVRAA